MPVKITDYVSMWQDKFSHGVFRCPIWRSELIPGETVPDNNQHGGGYGYAYYGDDWGTGYQIATRGVFWKKSPKS